MVLIGATVANKVQQVSNMVCLHILYNFKYVSTSYCMAWYKPGSTILNIC